MVSLKKYTLRAGILFTLLLTIAGLIATSTVIQDIQDNINQAYDLRTEYLNQDNEILGSAEDTVDSFNKLTSEELNIFVDTLLGADPDDPDPQSAVTLFNSVNDLNILISTRQSTNYALTDITSGFLGISTLFVEVPQTENIIVTENGASERFNEFSMETNQDFQDIRSQANGFRNVFEETRDAFQANNSEISDLEQKFQLAYQTFVEHLEEEATSTSFEIMSLSRYLEGNLTSLVFAYQQTVAKTLNVPINATTAQLESHANTTIDNVDLVISQIEQFPLGGEGSSLFEAVKGNATAVFEQMEVAIPQLSNFISSYQNVHQFVSTSLVAINDEINSVLDTTISIINQENQEFREQMNSFLTELQRRSSTNFIIVYGGISAIIIIVFLWIFLTLTLNFNRILRKTSNLSKGDLSSPSKEHYAANEVGMIEQSVDNFTTKIRSIVISMKQISELLAGISEELAASAEEASASISEVSSTVRQFSSGAAEQNLLLNRVSDELLNHLDLVEQTATNIDETASFVLQVADRTNILGLNASIEAAKAGQFGLGFNVVAEEVRNLSSDTRQSASEIAASIETIEFNIRQTVQDILEEVNIIREVAENTALGSSESSLATREQVSMMEEISETSSQLTDLSQSLNEILQSFTI